MASLRDVLRGPPERSRPNKAEGKASRSKQASKPEEDEMDRNHEQTSLELPLSGNAMAHIREIDASKLMPTDLIGMEDIYTTLTIVIIDWLRLKGGAADVPMLEDATLDQEAEIVVLGGTGRGEECGDSRGDRKMLGRSTRDAKGCDPIS